MEFDRRVKLVVYGHFAATGGAPTAAVVSAEVGSSEAEVRSAYQRLSDQRVLVTAADGTSITMAPPFSGVPTPHVVISEGVRYFANCAWDALGIPAALGQPAAVHSECAQGGDQLVLEVAPEGPPPSDWLFHCLVPAAHWWDDIGFT